MIETLDNKCVGVEDRVWIKFSLNQHGFYGGQYAYIEGYAKSRVEVMRGSDKFVLGQITEVIWHYNDIQFSIAILDEGFHPGYTVLIKGIKDLRSYESD